MSKLLSLCLGMSLGVLPTGCRTIKPDVAVEGAPQACCRSADPKLQNFAGCRVAGGNCQMRRGEKYWMRGAVACGAVDEAQCEGGRCCHYQPRYDPSINKPIENWAPPGFTEPTNNVTDPEAKPQHDVPEAGAPEGAPAPAKDEPKREEPTKAPVGETPAG
jgi:hypothetical protein